MLLLWGLWWSLRPVVGGGRGGRVVVVMLLGLVVVHQLAGMKGVGGWRPPRGALGARWCC